MEAKRDHLTGAGSLTPPDERAVGHVDSQPRQSLLRELNEQRVLEKIFRDGPVTRPEIAEHTNLSKPTVSASVRRLESAGLVHSVGPREGGRGRKPMSFVVSRRAGCVLGIDIGGNNLRAAVADIYGEILWEETEPTPTGEDRAIAVALRALIDKGLRITRPTHGELLTLAISTPGVVDDAGRASLAHNVSATGAFDPLAVIGGRYRVPALVENNVNLAAVGERWNGRAKGVSTFVYISIGAGVGMGISVDDELIRGAHGAAGEIAYLPIARDPLDARHRIHGGLEDEIGAAGILESLPGHGWEGPPPESAAEVFALAAEGDEVARRVVEHVGGRLGLAIATTCAILDPELVVLGGGIGRNPALLPSVRATVAALMPIPIRIEISALGEKAALYGAVAIALRDARDRFFMQGRHGDGHSTPGIGSAGARR